MNENEFNSTKHWSDLCVRLLQGPLFEDDNKEIFESLRLWNKEVNSYFNIIGLKLFYSDEIDYAYLQQIEDEDGNVIDNLNRLLKRHPLTYEVSLILVILREELDKFELENINTENLILKESEIADLVAPFYQNSIDKVKYNDMIATNLNYISNMNLIKRINTSADNIQLSNDREYIIRNIIRAKVDANFLKEFKEQLEVNEEKDQ
ncbi:MAG: DUF4194 domain-containing protein [Spirochaetia bacterium]|nr:DUF4194 domain-containing protein [Spirochaetia bacterium]